MNDAELYQRRLFSGGATDSTTVTTTASAPSGDSSPRVARTARRRSRASRRAPTTLLNTDTANFRAMVQQFTGIPPAPSYTADGNFHHASVSPALPPVINFGRYTQPPHPSSQPYQQGAPPPLQPYHNVFQPQQQQQLFSLGENPNDVYLSSGFAGNPTSDQGIFYEGGISGQMGNRSAPAAGDHRSDTYYL